jgi:hypothetical protein
LVKKTSNSGIPCSSVYTRGCGRFHALEDMPSRLAFTGSNLVDRTFFSCCRSVKLLSTTTSWGFAGLLCFVVWVCSGLWFGCAVCCLQRGEFRVERRVWRAAFSAGEEFQLPLTADPFHFSLFRYRSPLDCSVAFTPNWPFSFKRPTSLADHYFTNALDL